MQVYSYLGQQERLYS